MTQRGHKGRAALPAAGRSIGTALALMAASSALGFFSFLPTDYRGVSELGLIAGFSMVVAFVTTVTVLPAMLALMPLRAPAPRVEEAEHHYQEALKILKAQQKSEGSKDGKR
jgi:predicted RND superfamily exporter protein